MKFILFGAGWYGQLAMHNLGEEYVECFVDNIKHGTLFWGKRVISFEELVSLSESDNFCIIITSLNYADVFAAQLDSAGISHYFFYPSRNVAQLQDKLPIYNSPRNTQYMSYADALSYYKISQYKRIVIWGCDKYIEYLLLEIALLNSLKNIVGIVDSDNTIHNYWGIPIISPEQINESDCLIINKKRTETNIRDILAIQKPTFDIVDLYDVERFITYNHRPELAKYKDLHKGKRAFIIGNGPSLTVEDLNTLHKNNEICFAANYIYRIYDKTPWRPNYLCMTDYVAIQENESYFDQLAKDSLLFVADCYIKKDFNLPNLQPVHLILEDFAPNMPNFSHDITHGVYMGYSVLYNFALQIAAYMGVSEIYLLGVDHNLAHGTTVSSKDHFIDNYLSNAEIDTRNSLGVIYHSDKVTLGFQKAELYSRTNDFRIYNATRGGKLEVFERVPFDSLF